MSYAGNESVPLPSQNLRAQTRASVLVAALSVFGAARSTRAAHLLRPAAAVAIAAALTRRCRRGGCPGAVGAIPEQEIVVGVAARPARRRGAARAVLEPRRGRAPSSRCSLLAGGRRVRRSRRRSCWRRCEIRSLRALPTGLAGFTAARGRHLRPLAARRHSCSTTRPAPSAGAPSSSTTPTGSRRTARRSRCWRCARVYCSRAAPDGRLAADIEAHAREADSFEAVPACLQRCGSARECQRNCSYPVPCAPGEELPYRTAHSVQRCGRSIEPAELRLAALLRRLASNETQPPAIWPAETCPPRTNASARSSESCR